MSRFSMDWSELSLQVMITFGHFLWQACVIGMLLAIGQQALEIVSGRARALRSFETIPDGSRRSASFRYTIACIAFFSLPICVTTTFAWVHQSRVPIMLVASGPVESPSLPMEHSNEANPTMANSDFPVLPPSSTPMNAEVPVAEPPTLGVEPQTSSLQRIQAFAPYLLLAYMVGAGFMLARFLLSIIGSSRLRQTIQPITDVKLLRTIAEQCARVGLKRVPLVALCQRVSVPVVVGIVKPIILLPPALLCGLDPNQIAAILSHEIAHIRRYDLIVNLLQRIVEALLFFHPVTWWISRRVSIERENCCDDVAAACMGRLPYAGALLQMAELCIGNDRRRSAALATLSASGSNSTDLGYRIRRLIGAGETTRVGFTRRSFSIGLALVSLLTVSFVAWGQSPKSEDKNTEDGAEQKILRAVIQALQNPEVKISNNPIAPIALPDFPSKLRAIPQQDLVIDSLLNLLIDPPAELDIDERRNALRYLVFESPDRLTTLLIERLSTDKLLFPDTIGIAVPYDEIDALGQIGEAASDAIPVLTKFLNAEQPEVRGTAIEALIRVGPRSSEVMQSIATKFDDPHKVVRGLAVYQVGRYGKLAKLLGPKFTELLDADTKEVQCWAAAALITSEFNLDLGFKKLIESSQMGSIVDRKQALTSLAMLGSRAESVLPQLRTMIDNSNSEFAKEVRETIRRVETNDRIFTHAEEAEKKAVGREAVAFVADNPANRLSTGALKGRVSLDGVVPLLPKIRVRTPASPWITKRPSDEQRKKYEASLVEIDDESIQVDADQGLANAFVYLAKAPSNWQTTQEDLKPFTLTMQDDRFAPRAAILRTGQNVRLNNSSDGADNFAFEPMTNDGQNRAVGARAEITLDHPFTIPERTPIQAKSQMHPWKTTFLLPLDHPFAAITDSNGNFSIEGLPPGEHAFHIWHERTGWLEKSLVVNIQAGQTTDVSWSYSADRFRLAANQSQTDISQQSSVEKPDSRKQSFKLIDGETGKPLQGLKCRTIFAKLNAAPRHQACTTDEHGVVEVVVAKDESAGIAEVPSGWFSNGFGPMYLVAVPESEQQPQQNAETKNEEPKLLKLWRGTEVTGRLLWPDRTPAAGVRLTAGVYINHQSWKEKLGMSLTWHSFDHGDWPNWSRTIVTDNEGKFRVTVPPKNARFWLRIGTTQLGFSPQTGVGEENTITRRLAKCVPLEIQYGGSSRSNLLIFHDIPETDDMFLHTGDLQLETGVIVRGRVVDAEGKGLSNVRLTSTGPHGPHSGRSATSGEDGKFEFPAMVAGNLTVHPDARLRDVTKPISDQVISRDVQAVFVDQSFTIPSVFLPHEITVRAVPHTEVTFEWVDRRADKTQPIAYYGAFRIRGYMPDENGKPATYWTSETERVERNGKQWLTVKIPTQLLKPELMLVADSKVTASYSDSTGVTSGPGIVELGDITANTTRTIFGDEPLEPESAENKQKDQSPSKSESAVRKRVYDLGGTMEVRERNGDAEEVRLHLMSKDKLASDEDLKLFATLKNLTRLEFRADHITSQGLDHISVMTNLKNLHLWDGRLSDDDVGKLTGLKRLEWLGLYNCRNVTDRSSQHLLQLPELHTLNLYGTPITASFLQAIQGPRIRFLDLRRTGIKGKDLSVIEKFPNLRQINLPDEVTDADLSHLSGLSELKTLTLQDLNISDKGLLHLKALTNIDTLYLRNTLITDAGISHILDMQNLETLDLSGTQISSAGLLPLATLPKLQILDLQRTRVDDEGLKILSQFPRLQFLDVQDTNTTEPAVTALRKARPKMKIQWSK